MGHACVGLDESCHPVFDRLAEFFRMPRIIHTIARGTPLPIDVFDVIVSHVTQFDVDPRLGVRDIWDEGDWAFFLDDIMTKLSRGGYFYLHTVGDWRRPVAVQRYLKERADAQLYNRLLFYKE